MVVGGVIQANLLFWRVLRRLTWIGVESLLGVFFDLEGFEQSGAEVFLAGVSSFLQIAFILVGAVLEKGWLVDLGGHLA